MDQPLISVILPVYNAAEYLAECLEQLLEQSYSNLEIIAIDDFSRDNSFKILQKYSKQDKRLHIARNVKHYGIALTLNRCLKHSNGTLIAFMNAKDASYKYRLERQLKYLQDHEKAVAVGVQCRYANEKQQTMSISEFPAGNMELYKTPMDGVSLLFENLMVHKLRIPRDVLHFKTNTYPFIYTDVVIKLSKYGEIANLSQVLYALPRPQSTPNQFKINLQLSVLCFQLSEKSRSVFR